MFLEKFGGNDVAMFRMLRARKFDVDLAATLVKVYELLVTPALSASPPPPPWLKVQRYSLFGYCAEKGGGACELV
jgi:hypothetical protein